MSHTIPVTNSLGSRRIRVEREWEYLPAVGSVAGYYKNTRADRVGTETHLVIKPADGEKLFLNGKEIEIPPFSEKLFEVKGGEKEILRDDK